ncbi:hypothetical protein PF005_g26433 [Phytophthora fragariae]|uniref:Secreted protein n=2 Tax=Phytophthora TaxID=4783 RepID=A0A6A3DX07_9STRA|nr:hypothetical protein PF003_g28361 [Phytophthora fragariae]KAE8974559.1 hypothetical protein PR002_g25878 [Phytophthora rubi]KAE8924467.1 hypothetical protein PF009_g25300 [Phytophthora fragariae]KAE8977434.1 hypothetical protein PF011_g23652 [Phytophthora fragariae]KAE8985254.1 hypothetical protein PR001_g22939 [Phytophthora rubi]
MGATAIVCCLILYDGLAASVLLQQQRYSDVTGQAADTAQCTTGNRSALVVEARRHAKVTSLGGSSWKSHAPYSEHECD